jgi:hypothetical protein
VAAGLSSPEAQRRTGQPATQARPQPGVTSRTAHLEMAFPAVLTAAVLAGFVLRLLLLDRFPLREDEAIYAYWARYGREVDWRFLQVWPDKPPLFIAALALAFETWGASPAAARFVNIAASVLTIPVVAVTARRWWGPGAGIAAALALTFSPFAISFASTVYTDPLLVLTGSLALCAAAYRRPFWAGLWLAAAIMTKQQGFLYVPLVVAVLGIGFTQRRQDAKMPFGAAPDSKVARGEGRGATPEATGFVVDGVTGTAPVLPQRRRDAEKRSEYAGETPLVFLCESRRLRAVASRFSAPLRTMLFFTIGLLLIAGPVLWWDSLRWAVAPSPWDLGAHNVGALTLLPPGQWPGRAAAWLALAWQLQASWPVWLLLALLTGAGLLVATRKTDTGAAWPAWLVAGWGFAFLALHIVTSVQVWDRYLLPLAPVVALLAGWSVAVIGGATDWLTPRRKGAKARPDYFESNLKMAHAKTQSRKGFALPLAQRTHGVVVPLRGMDTLPRLSLRVSASLRLCVKSGGLTNGCFAALALAAMLLLAPPAFAAADGRLPVGGDHGAYAGLDDALALIAQPLPLPQSPISNLPISQSPLPPAPRTVLYHHNLGWQAQFYLFDAVTAGRVEPRWIPSATALADNAAKTPHLRRYLVEADWAPVRDLALQLAARHLRLESVLRRGHFTVYAITAQPPAAAANWRVCAPSAPWPVWAGARGEGRGAPTSQFTIDHSPFTISTARGEGRGAPTSQFTIDHSLFTISTARGEGRGAPTSQFTIDHSPFTISTARGEGRGAPTSQFTIPTARGEERHD